MRDNEQIPTIAVQRFTCLICGTVAECADGWGRTRDGDPVCPSCVVSVHHQHEEETRDVNLLGGFLCGAVAGAIGSAIWYALAVLENHEYAPIAAGIGLLVGIAVVKGAGHKHTILLQWISGVLAFAALLGGKYLILNHNVRESSPAPFSGWLTIEQFLQFYRQALTASGAAWDIGTALLTVLMAVAVVRPIKFGSSERID